MGKRNASAGEKFFCSALSTGKLREGSWMLSRRPQCGDNVLAAGSNTATWIDQVVGRNSNSEGKHEGKYSGCSRNFVWLSVGEIDAAGAAAVVVAELPKRDPLFDKWMVQAKGTEGTSLRCPSVPSLPSGGGLPRMIFDGPFLSIVPLGDVFPSSFFCFAALPRRQHLRSGGPRSSCSAARDRLLHAGTVVESSVVALRMINGLYPTFISDTPGRPVVSITPEKPHTPLAATCGAAYR